MIDRPVRVQRRRARGWRMPENTVYVGRPTRWGNPWSIGSNMYEPARNEWRTVENAADAVEAFRRCVDWDPDAPWGIGSLVCWGGYGDMHNNRKTIAKFLRGKNLACWCPLDKPCHADVLLELANVDAREAGPESRQPEPLPNTEEGKI